MRILDSATGFSVLIKELTNKQNKVIEVDSNEYSFMVSHEELKLPEKDFIKIIDEKINSLKEIMLDQNKYYREQI